MESLSEMRVFSKMMLHQDILEEHRYQSVYTKRLQNSSKFYQNIYYGIVKDPEVVRNEFCQPILGNA